MKFIRPTVISDAYLTSSSVPETDFAVWSAATTYAVSAQVIKGHRVWKSVQAANTGHDPEISGVSWWVDQGPTNRWAMFDREVGTATTAATSMTVILEPGRFDSLALLGVDAAQVMATLTVGGSTVWTRTESMIDSSTIVDWSGYFFDPVIGRSELVILGIPVYGEGILTAVFSKSSGSVAVGVLSLGLQAELGETLSSPTIGITDYSVITRDTYGVPTMRKGNYSKRCSVKLVLDRTQVDYVFSLLASVRATPMVWIGAANTYQSMLIYGFYKDFEIDIAYTTFSYCTLTIEGMT